MLNIKLLINYFDVLQETCVGDNSVQNFTSWYIYSFGDKNTKQYLLNVLCVKYVNVY